MEFPLTWLVTTFYMAKTKACQGLYLHAPLRTAEPVSSLTARLSAFELRPVL